MEISRNHLASVFGVSTRTVNDLETRGIIVKFGFDTYDQSKCTTAYCNHLREIAAGRGGEAAGQSLVSERARLAKQQADAHEIKNAKLRGDLLAADDVAREWTAIMQKLRAGLLAIPARAQQRLMHLTVHDVSELDLEIRAALGELADDGNSPG